MKKALVQRIVLHLLILKELYEDDVVPTMVDDGDHAERIEDIENLLGKLGYKEEEGDEDDKA